MSIETWPSQWAVASLEKLTSLITSGSRDWKPYYGKGDGVFILTQNVRMRELDFTDPFRVGPPANDPAVARSRVEVGDVLVNIVGGVGTVARVAEPLHDHFVCQSVALLRPVDADLSAWLEFYLSASGGGQDYFREKTYGLGRPHLSFADLRAMPIPVPPREEQDRIVATVEQLSAQIDEGEQYFKLALSGLAPLRESLLERCWDGFETAPLDVLLAAPMKNGRSVPTAEDGFPVLRLTALRDGVVDVRESKVGAWTEDAARPFLVEHNDFSYHVVTARWLWSGGEGWW